MDTTVNQVHSIGASGIAFIADKTQTLRIPWITVKTPLIKDNIARSLSFDKYFYKKDTPCLFVWNNIPIFFDTQFS